MEEMGEQRGEQGLTRDPVLRELDPVHRNEPGSRIRSRGRDLKGKFLWFPEIVSVQKGQKFTTCSPNASIARFCDATVWLPYPYNPVAIRGNPFRRIVRGPVVDDDHFVRWMALGKNTLECGADVRSLIVCRDDYANKRGHIRSCC